MKRKMYSILFILLATVMLFLLASCSMSKDALGGNNQAPQKPSYDNLAGTVPEMAPSEPEAKPDGEDTTNKFTENPFVSTEDSNVSTLSADVDTASYT